MIRDYDLYWKHYGKRNIVVYLTPLIPRRYFAHSEMYETCRKSKDTLPYAYSIQKLKLPIFDLCGIVR